MLWKARVSELLNKKFWFTQFTWNQGHQSQYSNNKELLHSNLQIEHLPGKIPIFTQEIDYTFKNI